MPGQYFIERNAVALKKGYDRKQRSAKRQTSIQYNLLLQFFLVTFQVSLLSTLYYVHHKASMSSSISYLFNTPQKHTYLNHEMPSSECNERHSGNTMVKKKVKLPALIDLHSTRGKVDIKYIIIHKYIVIIIYMMENIGFLVII